MRSLLLINNQAMPVVPDQLDTAIGEPLPDTVLEANGYYILHARIEEQAMRQMADADAIVLHIPLGDIKACFPKLSASRKLPIFWWCGASTSFLSAAFCEDDVPVDGILTPSMSERELHWALHFGSKQCIERQQWQSERKQLEARLEERKWIDMAKGILCDIKKVSEAEAYELLRKQAMNERKRLVDVATSIVKVYQLLQEQK